MKVPPLKIFSFTGGVGIAHTKQVYHVLKVKSSFICAYHVK
jgi:hypothetical protein